MAELIQTLLNLSREDQLRVIAILAEHLQSEEASAIPEWQIKLAEELEADITKQQDQLIAEAAYWAEIYAHRSKHREAS